MIAEDLPERSDLVKHLLPLGLLKRCDEARGEGSLNNARRRCCNGIGNGPVVDRLERGISINRTTPGHGSMPRSVPCMPVHDVGELARPPDAFVSYVPDTNEMTAGASQRLVRSRWECSLLQSFGR